VSALPLGTGRKLVLGMVEADPLGAMAYRKAIDAWDIAVIAEVDSPHFRMHGSDLSTGQVAMAAAADGVFVGGCLEPDGWGGAIDVERVRTYVDIVRELEQ
jgi:uncharacterized protein